MRIIITTLLCFALWQVNAQKSFTLKEAIAFGISNNAEVKNANIDIEIAEKKVWETTAMGLPQVSANAEFKNFIDIPTTVLPASAFNPLAPEGELTGLKFGTEYNLTGSLQVSQLIFSGNYLVGLQASKVYAGVSLQLKEKKELAVKESVASAYYTVLVLQANSLVLDSTLLTVEELFNQTKILVDEKVAESTNADQLELTVLQVKNAISQVDQQIQVAKTLLKFNMGYDLKEVIELSETLDSYTEETLNMVNPIINTEENIDHRILATQLTLSELNLKVKKSNYLPTLAGFFTHQQVAQRNEFNFLDGSAAWYPTTLWGLTLDIPIFSSGQRASQVSQAKLEVLKSQNSMQQVDEGLRLQMGQANAEYQTALESYTLQSKSASVAKKILNSTIIKYKEGIVSSMDLTQAQNQFLQTQTELINANFNLLNAKLKIDKLQNKL